MIFKNLKGIIELGNVNIKCVIFRINENNESEILSTSIIKSEGIHNGAIINLINASKAIRTCISSAEKKIESSLKKINIAIEQPEFLCTKLSKSRKINGSKIYKEDIEFLLKEAKKQILLNDKRQEIIHIFNHNYIVDGKSFIEEPINVFADHVSHEMTFITMPKNSIKNINQAFLDCDIEVERFISSTFALSVQLLSSNELKSGSALLNIGSDKISLGLFKNLALIHSITFPFGVSYLYKDISKVCSLSLHESEKIIDKIDFSFDNNLEVFSKDNYLKEVYFKDSGYRKISQSLILNIIKSRLKEMFNIVKKQIIQTGLNSTCGKNLLITGGGSDLKKIDKYFSSFFDLSSIKVINKSNEKTMEDFAACLGCVKIIKDGWETEAIPKKINKNNEKTGFFSKIFG
jgi:cell division protein FtsA